MAPEDAAAPEAPPLDLRSPADANLEGRVFSLRVMGARPRATPTPCSRSLLEREIEEHRAIWCTDYDDCLDHAADRQWPAWSCAKCPWMGVDDAARADGEARQGMHRGPSIAMHGV